MTAAHQIASSLLDGSAIEIKPSIDAFDWNGLPTVAGVNDEGDEFQCLGAFSDGRLVGSVIYQNTGDMLWIEHVYVTKRYRQKGIATALLNKVAAENPRLPFEGNWKTPEMLGVLRKIQR